MEIIVIATYGIWAWKMGWTKAPANAPFWTFVVTTYEIDGDYSDDDKTSGNSDERSNEIETVNCTAHSSATDNKLGLPL